ncbi:hypothetical protein [Nitrosomonas communis]|uniref:hypothetical protein n=1 Tax=Nitrosomonas communis TaxID=44574 RepID=UPI0011153E72|nr:hypothetical protein [Nitrosomonas communis]
MANKGYDSDAFIQTLTEKGIKPIIPLATIESMQEIAIGLFIKSVICSSVSSTRLNVTSVRKCLCFSYTFSYTLDAEIKLIFYGFHPILWNKVCYDEI